MHIAQMLDTLDWGGAQMMQLFLVETLQPLGIEMTVISLMQSSDSPFEKKLREAGVDIVFFPFHQLFSPGSFIKLVNYLRQEKFDLIHAYLTYSNIVGPLAGRLTGTPTIASLRSSDFENKSYTVKRAFLETFTMRFLATRVMANGLAVEKYARHRLKDSRNVYTIPNAVDFARAIPDDERQQIRSEITGDLTRPLVLTVGRLSAAKGFHDLIKAFAFVHTQVPAAVLVIAGGGFLFDELKSHIEKLGLEEQIILLGARADVPHLLAAADIYVNSSHREGTPVSVLEAMAAGLPVVATRVGENPYLLDPDAGLLVAPHQPQALAAAIISLLNSEELRKKLGNSARERIQRSYSRETWRKSLLTLYSEITPEAKPYLELVIQNSILTEAV
ncbi:MAG: glycosyltransferase [Chloroflexi bacterium]|nr:glycosyltransferase [Chloroflexota bacterium]